MHSRDGAPQLRRHRGGGFTLLEVLIVIVCLSFVALLVVPMAGREQLTRVEMAARLLVADLEYAQICSIGNGADPCLIVFDPGGAGYHVARSSDPLTPIRDPASGMPYSTTFGDGRARTLNGVSITGLSVGGDDQLGFDAMGALDQTADASMTLQCGAENINVSADAVTGEPSVN